MLMVLGLIGGFLLFFVLSERTSQRPATASDTAPASDLGTLIVRLTPSAKASLDGTHAPDGGQKEAAEHRFTGLDPRTYRLKVFRAGYETTFLPVSVSKGQTTIEVSLRPAH